MRLTKRQLKRIIREEYSRLQRRGLINEMKPRFNYKGSNDPFHRGGDRTGHDEMREACGGDTDIMMLFDYVWNDALKLGGQPNQTAQGLEGQPFMHAWDDMMSCLADCMDPQCQEVLDYCHDVEEMLY